MSLLWAKRGWLTPGSQTLRTLERFGASDVWDFVDNSYMRAGVVTTNAGLTVTRASDGYAETSDGTLVNFGSGVLRRTDRGVLVEGARTNLILRSQTFTSSWSSSAAGYDSAITNNATTAPDGTNTGNLFASQNLGGTGTAILAFLFSATSGTTYTLSFFAKANTLSWITLFNLAYGANGHTYFDLGNGVIGNVAALNTATITPYANGWYRCSITFTATVTGLGEMRAYVADGNNDTTISRDGNTSIFIWGAQLEAASFASSYIPTVASTVTRAADEVLVNPYTFPAPFSAYAEYVPGGNAASQNTALSFAVATTNEQVHIGKDVGGTNTNEAQLYVQNAGDQAWIRHAAGTANVGATVRQAVRVGANDFASSVGGSAALTDTSGTVPTMDRIRFGTDRGSTAFLFGYLRRAAIFPAALTDAQLQGLTS